MTWSMARRPVSQTDEHRMAAELAQPSCRMVMVLGGLNIFAKLIIVNPARVSLDPYNANRSHET
jgi:hypothetical protein